MPWWGYDTNVNFSILNLTQRKEDVSQCPPVQAALCSGECTLLSLDCRMACSEFFACKEVPGLQSRELRQCMCDGKDISDFGDGVRVSAVLVAS